MKRTQCLLEYLADIYLNGIRWTTIKVFQWVGHLLKMVIQTTQPNIFCPVSYLCLESKSGILSRTVVFRVEECSVSSRLLQFLKEIQEILKIKIFIYYTLELDINWKREKRKINQKTYHTQKCSLFKSTCDEQSEGGCDNNKNRCDDFSYIHPQKRRTTSFTPYVDFSRIFPPQHTIQVSNRYYGSPIINHFY